jgi:hypothetical protein
MPWQWVKQKRRPRPRVFVCAAVARGVRFLGGGIGMDSMINTSEETFRCQLLADHVARGEPHLAYVHGRPVRFEVVWAEVIASEPAPSSR